MDSPASSRSGADFLRHRCAVLIAPALAKFLTCLRLLMGTCGRSRSSCPRTTDQLTCKLCQLWRTPLAQSGKSHAELPCGIPSESSVCPWSSTVREELCTNWEESKSASQVVELVEREVPQPEAGQVPIKVEACGVCHSDSAVKEGYWPGLESSCVWP